MHTLACLSLTSPIMKSSLIILVIYRNLTCYDLFSSKNFNIFAPRLKKDFT
jgi:hypothetical protein